MSAQDLNSNKAVSGIYPTLALRDLVMFPGTVSPLYIGRAQSIAAIEEACLHPEQRLFMTAQKDPEQEEPNLGDLYQVGCVGVLLQVLKMQDGTIKVLVEAEARAKINTLIMDTPYLLSDISLLEEIDYQESCPDNLASKQALISLYGELLEKNKLYPKELKGAVSQDMSLSLVTNLVAAHLKLSQDQKRFLLMELDVIARADILISEIKEMLNQIELDQKIQQKVKQRMDDSQLKYYLNEKLNAVQNELNDVEGDTGIDDLTDLEDQIESAGLSKEAHEKAHSELNKLRMMPPMSSEATVIRHYLDHLLELPWKQSSKLNRDLNKAKKSLDQDHYGIEKVKERILEYLAVEKRSKSTAGPILCLVGPPGVGKTSLGESIAKATGREFVKLSLGGMRDEAEIRGHRKTYIGAMPGRIMQKLAKCKKNNPVFMLDEIDKLGADFRGDPAAALLEVLDPSQNKQFNDHYLEVDFDLSKVMFIATANTFDIPHALLDRLEIISLSGYTELEKVAIAQQYLLKKSVKHNGLKHKELQWTRPAITEVIRHYTAEAGVRELARQLDKVARKVVYHLVTSKQPKTVYKITSGSLKNFLGPIKYTREPIAGIPEIGLVNGLAWTEVGGEMLKIEVVYTHGKGNIHQTGSLGDVMQESIQAALTVAKVQASGFSIPTDFFENHDVHIHLPEGATPKDGPSAGIGLCSAILSAIAQMPVRQGLAMTGEITLRGQVLAIGGLKEKLLAAMRAGVEKVLIPAQNKKDLVEIPQEVKQALTIIPVKTIEEVLFHCFDRYPTHSHEKVDASRAKQKNNRVVQEEHSCV